ncbi:winged helix-turn-helix transcriptional regulator [Acholeplasma laidlawii]|uniref:winged helix-turn-helix transcriptional regulator n=1 Tax=Acholeplasma laidlawii TaxID=2148 RepID=UPI0021F6FE9F|nr:winged helix-turn-helix transcriptional regulator [Acholeplasma laidlawii]
MGNNQVFFKSTPLYKEYLLLEAVENKSNITQRELSRILDVAVSMINEYLDKEEKNGYITKIYKSSKDVQYIITDSGKERVKLLNIQYLKSALSIHNQARKEITLFLHRVIKNGFKNIILYGAGDVTEIILQTLEFDRNLDLCIVGIIDDAQNKIGSKMFDIEIKDLSSIRNIEHDGILISTYLHQKTIEDKLNKIKYDESKIIRLFH